jgi:NAD(P)H-hydrate epimerase
MISQQSTMHFIAETGVDVPAVSAEQMRELDRIATEETGPSLLQMMENAGRNLALLAMELMEPHWRSAKVMVLAGSGGNGGGGICAGRHLANQGVPVSLCLSSPYDLSEAATVQRKIFQSTAGKEVEIGEVAGLKPDLILDAMIGYGLKSAPRSTTADLIAWAGTGNVPILALDVPSGVDATTGDVPGAFIRPTWTMTLALPKLGLLPENAGQLFLADIGIPVAAFRRLIPTYVSPYGNRFWVGLKHSWSTSHQKEPGTAGNEPRLEGV